MKQGFHTATQPILCANGCHW